MQKAGKDKKEVKPSREEQEKGRALQREKAAKLMEKHEDQWMVSCPGSTPTPTPTPTPTLTPTLTPTPTLALIEALSHA